MGNPTVGAILRDTGGGNRGRAAILKQCYFWDGLHIKSDSLDKKTTAFAGSFRCDTPRPWIVMADRDIDVGNGAQHHVLMMPIATTKGNEIREIRCVELLEETIDDFPNKDQTLRHMMASCVPSSIMIPRKWLGMDQNLASLTDFWGKIWGRIEELWTPARIDAAFARCIPSPVTVAPAAPAQP